MPPKKLSVAHLPVMIPSLGSQIYFLFIYATTLMAVCWKAVRAVLLSIPSQYRVFLCKYSIHASLSRGFLDCLLRVMDGLVSTAEPPAICV